MEFIDKFATDSSFQVSHIKFPLEVVMKDEKGMLKSKWITRKNWRIENFYYDGNCSTYTPQIYDSFSMKMRETGERVFAMSGIDNGYYKLFFFKKINNNWFLIKIKNLSD
jgi:hypothetical protein